MAFGCDFGDTEHAFLANFSRAWRWVLMNLVLCFLSFFHAKRNCQRNMVEANAFSISLSPFSVADFFSLKIAVFLYLV